MSRPLCIQESSLFHRKISKIPWFASWYMYSSTCPRRNRVSQHLRHDRELYRNVYYVRTARNHGTSPAVVQTLIMKKTILVSIAIGWYALLEVCRAEDELKFQLPARHTDLLAAHTHVNNLASCVLHGWLAGWLRIEQVFEALRFRGRHPCRPQRADGVGRRAQPLRQGDPRSRC